jgi:hypothetical protein
MSLLQLICFFLDRKKEKDSHEESSDESSDESYDESCEDSPEGYFFFDEDTGEIHNI